MSLPMSFSQRLTIQLASPAPAWRVAEDVERLLDASVGPAWLGLRKKWNALTENYTKFQDKDLVGLKAQVRDYRGPIERITFDANGAGAYVSVTLWVDENERTTRVWIHKSFDQRADMERLQHALAENVAILGKRSASRWHDAKLESDKMTHHVMAGAVEKQTAPVVSARSLKTKARRWFVMNRDGIIVTLSGGVVAGVVVIVLQAVGVIPVPQ
jgi:hypothetical protein